MSSRYESLDRAEVAYNCKALRYQAVLAGTSPYCKKTLVRNSAIVIKMIAQPERSGSLNGRNLALAQLHQVADTRVVKMPVSVRFVHTCRMV